MARFTDTTAFITGAASGIGRAIALRLSSEGAAVGIADLNLDGAHETERAITAAGGRAHAVRVDIASFDEVQQAVADVRSKLGPIGVLINNAGWDRMEPFVQNTPEVWEKILGINLKGPIYCCRAVLDDMIAANRGKIVSISSDAARVGSSGEAVYSACKGGIISFSKTLAREHARHHINVNVVCPGPTDTALLAEVASGEQGARIVEAMKRAVPMRRLGMPDDITGAVAFFASADADFITGQVLSVSGGLTMAG